uniref:Acyl-CoA thioesterase 11 n=1 Tax=Periophthalmus magnuspinnatus TaxID=409849 RepID=A0A3B4AQA3_9GOBI
TSLLFSDPPLLSQVCFYTICDPVSCLMPPVSCLLSHASCLMAPVSCLLSHASCLMPPVSWLLSPVCSVGQVVNIRARVNRAFNTSMEVDVHVSCEDLFLGRHWRVCHAYATFVTQRTKAGKKVMLKPLAPHSHSEHLEYSLAAERRRVRMLHDDIIRDLLASRVVEPGVDVQEKAVSAVKTRVESVELVLPPHANHQVNTFGGQIMAWMVNVATIAARYKTHPRTRPQTLRHAHRHSDTPTDTPTDVRFILK